MATQRIVSFTIPGQAVPITKKLNVRGDRPIIYEPADRMEFRAKVAMFAQQAAQESDLDLPFDEPVALHITFRMLKPKSYRKDENYPWKRPDLDNLMKPVIDECQGSLIRDDAQIVEEHIRKEFADSAGIDITITPVTEDWPY